MSEGIQANRFCWKPLKTFNADCANVDVKYVYVRVMGVLWNRCGTVDLVVTFYFVIVVCGQFELSGLERAFVFSIEIVVLARSKRARTLISVGGWWEHDF